MLKITYLEAKIFKAQLIGTEHFLLSILRDQDNLGTQILNKFDVNYETVKEMLEYQNEGSDGVPRHWTIRMTIHLRSLAAAVQAHRQREKRY